MSRKFLDFLSLFEFKNHEFCSLRAQGLDHQTGYTHRPDLASELHFSTPRIPVFRPVFARIGQNSAPEPPIDFKTGLSIVISAPLSVSEHQKAKNCSKPGQTGCFQKMEKKAKNEN